MGGIRGQLIPLDDRLKIIELINEANKKGARKGKACELLNLSVRTLERWEKDKNLADKRQSREQIPMNQLSEEEREKIVMIASSEKYCDLPPCKIVPMLADEGIYIASESSFYRILRENKQLSHRGHSRPKTQTKPRELMATGSNQVWSWDISYLPSQVTGMYFYLYLILDIYSRKIVGWSIHESESSDYAAQLIKQTCADENIAEHQIYLHSDNGSPMKGSTMLATLQNLGVTPSFSRPSVSDDNPYSESLFRTLKYHPTFPMVEKFEEIVGARVWSEKFVNWYNHIHLHSGLKFITPHDRHTGKDKGVIQNRQAVYEQAKNKHPERWSKQVRNWILPEKVMLNPDKKGQKNNASYERIEQKITKIEKTNDTLFPFHAFKTRLIEAGMIS